MADDWTTEQILQELWDDGNAVGLDGYTGPGRGAYVVDGEAIAARDVATKKGRERLAATIRQAEIAAVRAYADQLGVYVGDEDSEFYRGYRQAQREAIRRAERYLEELAADGESATHQE